MKLALCAGILVAHEYLNILKMTLLSLESGPKSQQENKNVFSKTHEQICFFSKSEGVRLRKARSLGQIS